LQKALDENLARGGRWHVGEALNFLDSFVYPDDTVGINASPVGT
jgi:hypothetical protein